MKEDKDGKPVVDASAKGLGARLNDVDLDDDGKVILNAKGMSVAPAWRDLSPYRVSKTLRDKYPDARGASDLRCFTMGEGPFQDGPVAAGLYFIKDHARHGVVAPIMSVTFDQYQSDLANTRDLWVIDEV